MYEPKKMKLTGHLFRVFAEGQVPDFWEVLGALDEISDLNSSGKPDSDTSIGSESPKCPDCG